jgi:anti-sigma factor RsiW
LNPSAIDDRTLVDYLLGRLPEPQRALTEERIFMEATIEEDMLATADDLIAAYLKGTLPPDDRTRFESHFLAVPRHQQRLAFMRDLGSAVEQVARSGRAGPEEDKPATLPHQRQFWLVAAALILVVAGLAFVLTRPSEDSNTRTAVVPSPISATPTPSAQPQPTTSPAQAPRVHVVRLLPKSSALVTLPLPEETRLLRLEVSVPEGPPSFDASLKAADGTEAWRTENLAPPASGRRLVLNIPAEALRSDEYTLRIEGEPLRDVATPPVLSYRVRVIKGR